MTPWSSQQELCHGSQDFEEGKIYIVLAGSNSSIAAEVALDIGLDDLTRDAILGLEPAVLSLRHDRRVGGGGGSEGAVT